MMQFPDIELGGAQFVGLLKVNMHISLMLSHPTSVSQRRLEYVAKASTQLLLYRALKAGSSRRTRK
jgi:hypothetical protein